MKYTLIILASILSLSCKTGDEKAYDQRCEVKAKEYISAQFPKVNWREATCGKNLEAPDAAGFVDCKVYGPSYWGFPLLCSPQKCICEICEQLK